MGVNTFKSKDGSPTTLPDNVMRSSDQEKQNQLSELHRFHQRHASKSARALNSLKDAVLTNKNVFEELMETVKHCSLGEITKALYEVGGQYRRNL